MPVGACLPPASQPLCASRSDEWVVFETVKGWLKQTSAAPAEAARRLLGHVRFPRLAKERQLQLETDELALQHLGLIAKAYREALNGEDTPRTRARSGSVLTFKELKAGMTVQVMGDLKKVKAACEAAVGLDWNSGMERAVGKTFVVDEPFDDAGEGATLRTDDLFGMTMDFSFPCTTLLHWRPARSGLALTSNELKVGMAVQVLLAWRYCSGRALPLILAGYTAGGACYACGRILTVRGAVLAGHRVHCGVHVFANLGNLLILPYVV